MPASEWPLRSIRTRLLSWYDQHRRDLPWRTRAGTPPAYHVLVSEFMLQQTQVATVIPYFHRFMKAFPRLPDLARAPEQQVLRLWQGLGYYSRARNLHRTARAIVEHRAGEVPRTVEALLDLPGVGRYTAGAIASLAYDVRAPILDGNVVRVLCRLRAITDDPRTPARQAWLWKNADELVAPARPGDFNSALMELGATLCTPRNPQCPRCPLASTCQARAKSLQEQIPLRKERKAIPTERRTVWCAWRHSPTGPRQYLFERRPARGRWASMWQFPARPVAGDLPDGAGVLPSITHQLTHRRYEFGPVVVPESRLPASVLREEAQTTWQTLAQSESLPLPKPHVDLRERLSRLSSS